MPERDLTLVGGLMARLVEVAAGCGIPRGEFLSELGLTAASLEDRDNRLPVETFARGWNLLSHRHPGRALALDWVRSWKITDAGVMGYVFAQVSTLGEPVPMETPQGDAVGYAMGWGSAPAGWAEGQMLLHDGSNGSWRARIRLGPKRGLGFLIVTNAGDDRALHAVRRAFEKLVERAGGQRR